MPYRYRSFPTTPLKKLMPDVEDEPAPSTHVTVAHAPGLSRPDRVARLPKSAAGAAASRAEPRCGDARAFSPGSDCAGPDGRLRHQAGRLVPGPQWRSLRRAQGRRVLPRRRALRRPALPGRVGRRLQIRRARFRRELSHGRLRLAGAPVAVPTVAPTLTPTGRAEAVF